MGFEGLSKVFRHKKSTIFVALSFLPSWENLGQFCIIVKFGVIRPIYKKIYLKWLNFGI
jgi:hypothetical protein